MNHEHPVVRPVALLLKRVDSSHGGNALHRAAFHYHHQQRIACGDTDSLVAVRHTCHSTTHHYELSPMRYVLFYSKNVLRLIRRSHSGVRNYSTFEAFALSFLFSNAS
jgi:hypothetical protein